MQGQRRQAGSGQSLVVCPMRVAMKRPDAAAGLENTHSLRRGGADSSETAKGVSGSALAFNLVAYRDAIPLKIDFFPFQAGQFFTPRAGE